MRSKRFREERHVAKMENWINTLNFEAEDRLAVGKVVRARVLLKDLVAIEGIRKTVECIVVGKVASMKSENRLIEFDDIIYADEQMQEWAKDPNNRFMIFYDNVMEYTEYEVLSEKEAMIYAI